MFSKRKPTKGSKDSVSVAEMVRQKREARQVLLYKQEAREARQVLLYEQEAREARQVLLYEQEADASKWRREILKQRRSP
jgi:hypothetical protein